MNAGPDVVRLVAIARGLEDEGRYQAAKLFRAAAKSETARRSQERPRSDADLARALDEGIAELRAAGHDPELLAAMDRVSEMVRDGAMHFPDDIRAVHVCRYCGGEMVGDPPERCPSCGAGRLSFEHVPSIYYHELVDRDQLVDALRTFTDVVAGICAGMSEERASAGEWPAREVVSHLLGAERLLAGRAVRTLDEDEPEFRAVPPTQVAEGGEQKPNLAELIERFRAARVETVRRFGALTDEQWRRIGRHPQWGRMSLHQQLSYLARHEHSHLADLQRAASGS